MYIFFRSFHKRITIFVCHLCSQILEAGKEGLHAPAVMHREQVRIQELVLVLQGADLITAALCQAQTALKDC